MGRGGAGRGGAGGQGHPQSSVRSHGYHIQDKFRFLLIIAASVTSGRFLALEWEGQGWFKWQHR